MTAIALSLGMWTVPGMAQANQPSQDAAPAGPATDAAPALIPPDQQPTKEQLAKLFEVMRLREQMQSVMKLVPAVVEQQVQSQMHEMVAKLAPGSALTPDQQAKLGQLMDKYVNKAMNVYPIEDMIADMTMVYQHHVSRTDVDAFIAFYGSPAGQHLLDAQPSITKEYMPIVMQRQQKATDDLTDQLQKDLEDFRKSIEPDTSSPTPK